MSRRHLHLNVRTLSLISICSLVLATALLWTRLEHAGSPCQFDWPGCAEPTVPDRDDGSVKPAATITVNSTSDTTNATDGLCTLREAITAANTDTQSGAVAGECIAGSGTDTISFSIPPAAPGCAGGVCTITLSGSALTVNTSLNIQGPGANLLTIAGNNTFRIFSLTAGGVYSVNFSGLTIANGGTTGTTGGGIDISSIATVRISSCVLRNNAATLGGAIANSSGTLTIENSTISNNTAGTAGGIYIGGPGRFNLINSTVAGNSATSWRARQLLSVKATTPSANEVAP